jgi:RNA polymerase sigma-70 factor (ECF subfamily)
MAGAKPEATGPVSTNPEAWQKQHGSALARYAMMRLHDPILAEEAIQETYLAALKARASFLGLSTERTWLVGILKHKIVDLMRKHVREKPLSEEELLARMEADPRAHAGLWPDGQSSWRQDPVRCQERAEIRKTLAECLEEMPRRQGEVFAMRELGHLSSGEICSAMGITETNLWVMLHRARLRLRSLLQARWEAERPSCSRSRS